MSEIPPAGVEIDERFHITGRRAIVFTLVGYIRDGEQFTVLFGDKLFVTQLLDVDEDDDLLIFDLSGAETLNHALLRADRCRLAARPAGIHVHFDVGEVSEIEYDGRPAFAVALPTAIVRLQRRESFRIATPVLNPVRFFISRADGKEQGFSACDISVTGIGLLAAAAPDLLSGELLERCRIRLPDEAQDMPVAARVQRIIALESRSGERQWRIGVHFLNLSPAVENRLQRYIARLERERHEHA
ncbi:MAG: flagellar brake protein [Desulfobulbus sp.]|nr:flagellar brake protein [Desulfobulbus sp.]